MSCRIWQRRYGRLFLDLILVLVYFSVFKRKKRINIGLCLEMLGPSAAARINQDGGVSVHRRTFTSDGVLTDCHVRISDVELSNGNYGPDYLSQLGSELSCIDHAVFQDLVKALHVAVGVHYPDGPILGGCPLYSDEKTQPELMLAMQPTVLASIFRNYMGKSLVYD